MAFWHAGEVRSLTLDRLGERYRRYRLPDPDAEAAMAGSVGQLRATHAPGRLSPRGDLRGPRRLQAARRRADARPHDREHAAPRGRRAAGQGHHLRPQPDRPADPGVGRGLDRARPGPRGRPDAGRGRRAAGPAQDLGVPAAGPGGAAGRRRPGGTPAGAAVGHRRAVAGAVAGRQPGGGDGGLSPGPPDGRGARRRGRAVRRRAGPDRSRSTSWPGRGRPCGRRGPRPAGPGTRGSVRRATAWRGGSPTCSRAWAGWRTGCAVRAAPA